MVIMNVCMTLKMEVSTFCSEPERPWAVLSQARALKAHYDLYYVSVVDPQDIKEKTNLYW